MDMFEDLSPHVIGNAEELPFADDTFDYVASCHLLEHLGDTIGVLKEWLRVVKLGGHVAAVVPDTRFTLGQNTDRTPHLHEWAPGDFERDILAWFWGSKHVIQKDFGPACPGWSFKVVLEKA